MRVLFAIAIAAVVAGFFTMWGMVDPSLKRTDVSMSPSPVPVHTFGDTVRERCWKETSRDEQSQKDCVFRYTMGKAFEQFNERNR
jgi:hypothetical protein